MATRLDRLINLLESECLLCPRCFGWPTCCPTNLRCRAAGSTPAIRQTAASQIGEIQKIHPYDLQNLLKRVCYLPCLRCGVQAS